VPVSDVGQKRASFPISHAEDHHFHSIKLIISYCQSNKVG
jgi:hypothetical protein